MYAKIENGAISKFPYSHANLRKDNPNTSFPADALSRADVRSDFNVVEIIDVPRPEKAGWKAVEEEPSLSNGTWTQNWKLVAKDVGDLMPEEIKSVEAPIVAEHTVEPGPPELVGDEWVQTWVQKEDDWYMNRKKSYGHFDEQIEFITENGLDAWITKVAEIKAKYPKGDKSSHDNRT
tara:strand:- start:37 stop:570 length:534 start_codon:yes stop_codon:yes gene_type:complete